MKSTHIFIKKMAVVINMRVSNRCNPGSTRCVPSANLTSRGLGTRLVETGGERGLFDLARDAGRMTSRQMADGARKSLPRNYLY